jgi:predicted transcriptional regulator
LKILKYTRNNLATVSFGRRNCHIQDNRSAAVKYYQLTPKGKEIFENILKILKK